MNEIKKDEKVIEPEILDEHGNPIDTKTPDATKEDQPNLFNNFGNFKTYQFKSANPILSFLGILPS